VVRQTLHLVIGQIVVVVDGAVPCGLGHAHRTTVRLQVEVLGGRIRDDAVHASPRRRIADRRVFLEEEPGVVGLPHQDHRERCVGPVGDGGARALDRRRLLLLDLVDRALPVVVDPGGEGVVARDERAQFLDGDRLELLDGGERRLLRVLEGESGVVCGGGEVFGGGDGDHDWGFQCFGGVMVAPITMQGWRVTRGRLAMVWFTPLVLLLIFNRRYFAMTLSILLMVSILMHWVKQPADNSACCFTWKYPHLSDGRTTISTWSHQFSRKNFLKLISVSATALHCNGTANLIP
jgi:hypothetical protein